MQNKIPNKLVKRLTKLRAWQYLIYGGVAYVMLTTIAYFTIEILNGNYVHWLDEYGYQTQNGRILEAMYFYPLLAAIVAVCSGILMSCTENISKRLRLIVLFILIPISSYLVFIEFMVVFFCIYIVGLACITG